MSAERFSGQRWPRHSIHAARPGRAGHRCGAGARHQNGLAARSNQAERGRARSAGAGKAEWGRVKKGGGGGGGGGGGKRGGGGGREAGGREKRSVSIVRGIRRTRWEFPI